MAFTYIRVTRTYELASDVPATGSVRFRPVDRMVNGLTVVSSPVTATLDGSGAIDVRLAATTDPATRPIGVTYEVREQITGQAVITYYVSVPHTAPGAVVDLSTLSVISPVDAGAFSLVDAADYDDTTPPANGNAMVWNGASSKWHPSASSGASVVTVNGESPDGTGNLVLSSSDVGAQPADADLTGLGGLGDGYPKRAAGTWAAQTATQLATDLGVQNTTPVTLTASGGTITPNAGSGWYFQHTATANVTLANPTGGTSGQLIVVDVFASGADRVVTLPAGSTPATVTVPSGTWHPFEQRNHSGTWQTIDYLAASSGGIPADGSVTNIKVASGAAISADKLADGSANKVMTSAERTKLAAVPTVMYATVQDEGTARTQRSILNFTGSGVTVTDDSSNSRTLVTIPGGGGGSGLPPGWFNITDYGASPGGVFNNATAINSAMTAAENTGIVFIPKGDFGVNTPIVFKAPIVGLGVDVSQISANPGFTGASVIDNNHGGERKFIRDLHISGGGVTACIGSTNDSGGSSSTLYENLYFTDTPPGVYAVGGSSTTPVPGMLTGAVFLRCSWNGCAQLLNIGQNQDDVTLISCRSAMDSTSPATDYQIQCDGQNIRFIGCYFGLWDTDQDYFGIKAFFSIGNSAVSVENCFFEAYNGTNLTHLFAVLSPSAHLSMRNLVVRNFATTPRTTTLAHVIYTNVEAGANSETYVELENIHYNGDAQLTSVLQAFLQDGVTGVTKTFKFSGIDGLSPTLWSKGSGSTSNAISNFFYFDGVHLGKTYRGYVSQNADGDLTLTDAGMDTTRYEVATASGVTPRTATITLPGSGTYFLHVSAKLNSATDHAMTGLWLVMYNNETNDTLLTTAIGATGKATGSSFGLNTLTASNPTAPGVITLSASWTDGASHAVAWAARARLVAPFGL